MAPARSIESFADLLLFAGWTGLALRKTTGRWRWMAAAGLACASASLFHAPLGGLGPGYWFWLASSATTAWARRPKFEDYGR